MYLLLAQNGIPSDRWVIAAIVANFLGLIVCFLFVRSLPGAKRMLLITTTVCLLGTALIFSPSVELILCALLVISFSAGLFISAWSYFLRANTPAGSRMGTVAKTLAFSSLIMTFINLCAEYVSLWFATGLNMALLAVALVCVHRMDAKQAGPPAVAAHSAPEPVAFLQPLAALCPFIFVITINAGLMFQVIQPAYDSLGLISDIYWAIPYLSIILLVNRIAKKVDQPYLLILAISMLGFAFIAFAVPNRSVWSYLLVNTLLLGACGIFDLYWWSILGELLEFDRNPARLLGLGLGANVAGVLAGKLIGRTPLLTGSGVAPTLVGLAVVCLALVLLPPLHRLLAGMLQKNTFLVSLSSLPPQQQRATVERVGSIAGLSERENEIAMLLLKGYPYKLIASRLYISESTVKTHVQSIYSKLDIHNRTNLIERFCPDGTPRM
ncbi:MAG: LuxR C-terminal-related transcriptional regulator [Eubacteriales bacterium]|nr:LuxR C-terminal-related transcriptional regulator [Eubacteriales bacterium]